MLISPQPGLKAPEGAYSFGVVCLSVCPSVTSDFSETVRALVLKFGGALLFQYEQVHVKFLLGRTEIGGVMANFRFWKSQNFNAKLVFLLVAYLPNY